MWTVVETYRKGMVTMSPETALGKRDHLLLIGDGFLLTAGTVSVGVALSYGLAAIFGDSPVSGIGIGLMLPVSVVAGVLLTWFLHGRRITVPAVLGGFVGSAAGGAMIPVVALLAFLLGLPLKLVTDWEFAGPVAVLVIVSTAVIALMAWLLIDAFRDLTPAQRAHARLDAARIASALVFALLTAVSIYLVYAQPGPEQGEAPIFVIAGGFVGAGVIAGADLMLTMLARKSTKGEVAAGA